MIEATAEEIHKHIVTTAVSSFREALTQVQHGLKHYRILDPVDAAESQKIADDLDNLIRRAKQHDVK